MSFYLISSKLSGLVLDVTKASTTAGAHVIIYTKHGKDNQIWYDDKETGTIRSKQTGFCLDIDGDALVVRPYKADNANQQWIRDGAFIKNRKNNKKALDVFGEKKSAGSKVGIYDFHGKPNQQWEFLPVSGASVGPAPAPAQVPQAGGASLYPSADPYAAYPHPPGRAFWIVSEFNQKVLDIQAASMAADAKAILWDRNPAPGVKNQLWHLDGQGFIRSTLNDFVFQSKETATPLRMAPFQATNTRGQWKVDGKKIVNAAGECLDVKGEDKENGAEVIAYKYKGAANQHWMLQYV